MSDETFALAPHPAKIEAIEEELNRLWPRAQEAAAGEEPVTRAFMSNLIVVCSDIFEARFVTEDLAEIVRRHPSRVLLLILGAGQEADALDAVVAARCHVGGERRQICSEQVVVKAGEDARHRLPSVVRPLLIGDLPTAMWWASRQPPSLAGDFFLELAEPCDQIIYDSFAWPDPVRGVVAAADWAGGAKQAASDLGWRRLKPWRRLIAQTLNPAVTPGALDSIEEIVIEHGPHALPQSWMLIGWLAGRLEWQPVGGKVTPGAEVTWGFKSSSGPLRVTVRRLSEGDTTVRSAAIRWKGGGATFAPSGPGRLGVTPMGTNLAAPDAPRAELVARQLPDLSRDALFVETLRISRSMAQALL